MFSKPRRRSMNLGDIVEQDKENDDPILSDDEYFS